MYSVIPGNGLCSAALSTKGVLQKATLRFKITRHHSYSCAVNAEACLFTAVIAYLLGSIPTGYLVGKAKGIDVRKAGSGNIGATNAFRILGKRAGIFVLVVDGLKGWAAVAWVPGLIHQFWDARSVWDAQTLQWLEIIASILVILGHNYPCWLKFKGGKGIATTAGVFLALAPWALLVAFIVFVLAVALTRYVSVGSMTAAVALTATVWIMAPRNLFLDVVTTALGVLAIYKHKSNLQRLLNGTENQLGKKAEVMK